MRPPQAAQAGAVASDLDSAIEDNFKATIKAHTSLNDQRHQRDGEEWHAGTEGIREDGRQRKEAGDLAKQVPNVQQVVNELK